MRAFDFPAFTLDASQPFHSVEIPVTANDLVSQHCQPLKGKEHALGAEKVAVLLKKLPGWKLSDDKQAIIKDFKFDDFQHTLGFINAVGFMANHEDHHPDIEAGYGHCQLLWSTHDVGGLSMNDFICAARVEQLLAK